MDKVVNLKNTKINNTRLNFFAHKEDVVVVLLCLAKYNSMSYVAFTPL